MTSSLQGLAVWVTRPAERADPTVLTLQERGANAAAVPFVRIVCLPSPPPLQAAREVDRLVFTSPTAVEHFVARVPAALRPELQEKPCHAVGAVTAAALRRAGYSQIVVAPSADADALAAEILSVVKGPLRILMPGSRIRRAQLPHALRAAGHEVLLWDLYDTVPANSLDAAAQAQLQRGERPLLLLYSPSAALAVRSLVAEERVVMGLPCAVLGPSTAAAAQAQQLHIVLQPERVGEAALLRGIEEWWASR